MSDRWQFGNYTFVINPNKYSENINYIGDNALTLNGTLISMPTLMQEQYTLSSTFYQGLPKVTSQVSVPNGSGVKLLSGNYYILNNTTKKIDQYNSNFSLIKSTTVPLSGGTNVMTFDIASNGTIYAIDDSAGGQHLYAIPTSGSATISTIKNIGSSSAVGIKYDSGNLWLVSDQRTLYQTDITFNVMKQLSLPYIDPQYLKYKGLEIVGNYLVLSFNSADMTGAYHIDKSTGIIANAFSLPSYTPVVDVTYDGKNFIFMTQTGSQLIYTNGNTLLSDIYTLESNIRNNGYIYMIDDMDIEKKVTVSNYSIDRVDGHLQMYNVDLTVSKIDRG